MISSVIAKLDCNPEAAQHVVTTIQQREGLETGAIVDGRLLPITIESNGNRETEELTRWISSLDNVAFVDVIYVHFEDTDVCEKPVRHQRV
jgi:nitrate reductase NapAB chaperone NapD